MELFKASRQWATRPADERFESLQELYNQTNAYRKIAVEKTVRFADLRVEAAKGEIVLTRGGEPANLTHWSFGQLCQRVGAPASYLRELPATLAAQNLNHGLAERGGDDKTKLMFHQNGSLLLRSMNGEIYRRIWNAEIAERLLELQEYGWEAARPDKRFDGGDPKQCQVCNGINTESLHADLRCQYCKGTGRAFPSLYASDHDLFAFISNKQTRVSEAGTDGLQRGVIFGNSEVGDSSIWAMRFLYREMCGNHIIWGAKKVMEFRMSHLGSVRRAFNVYAAEIKRYAEESASDEEAQIASARWKNIAATKEQVLDAVFNALKGQKVSRKTLEASYDAVNVQQDGPASSVWGFVQGMTRHSQTVPYAEQRQTIDEAAGKLIDAF